MQKVMSKILSLAALNVVALQAAAAPVYLNVDNITVAIGGNSTYTTSNNTFNGGQTVNKIIDAPTADASESHNQTTHNWFSGGSLELLFDFQQQYDLTTLHFWNYDGESYDVDDIQFAFFDGSNTQVGSLGIAPALGSSPNIFAQDIVLAAPLNVRYVTAVLTGSNNEIDFQNMGFTASLSTDRCETNPDDPVCLPSDVPVPPTLLLLLVGVMGIGTSRRRA